LSRQEGSGGVFGRPRTAGEQAALVRHEEEARVDTEWAEAGGVRLRRETTTERVSERFPRQLEEVEHERVPVGEGDSGEIEVLPDGSVSIPLFEEELVVTRRTVLRERVIVRKQLISEWETVEADLRREQIVFEDEPPPAA
jgi:uncharacterized protein (TIGR02271 family)